MKYDDQFMARNQTICKLTLVYLLPLSQKTNANFSIGRDSGGWHITKPLEKYTKINLRAKMVNSQRNQGGCSRTKRKWVSPSCLYNVYKETSYFVDIAAVLLFSLLLFYNTSKVTLNFGLTKSAQTAICQSVI